MKLLTHINRNYLVLAAGLLLLSVPAFYFAIDALLIHKLDEELKKHKNSFHRSLRYITTAKELNVYKHFYEEFSLREVRQKIKTDSVYTAIAYDSTEARMAPFRVLRTGIHLEGRHYELQIRESLISTRELIYIVVLIMAGILFFMLVGLLLVNRSMTKKVWSPFYNTLENLKKFELDKDKSILVSDSIVTEFQDLNRALINLTTRNHQSFVMQKEFTENASHELQTPIAICRSKLELLMQGQDLTKDQAELINNLYDATDRMARLNKNLLLLSRLENVESFDRQTVNLNQVVSRSLNTYHDQIQDKDITLSTSLDTPVAVQANPSLIETLVNNLVSNAVRFTPGMGTIAIALMPGRLTIANSGSPLAQPTRIFERFHREHKNIAGNGLGLAIVKKICDASDFQIGYSYENGTHRMTVQFS
jgi:signal transduction histidine kinase